MFETAKGNMENNRIGLECFIALFGGKTLCYLTSKHFVALVESMYMIALKCLLIIAG
jgi:hypothetical protein